MDRDMMLRLMKVMKELHSQVCRVYWNDPAHVHCGEEYDEELCFDCENVSQCSSSHTITMSLKYVSDRI